MTSRQLDPLARFQEWLDAVVAAAVPEPTAMVLATTDAAGRASARAVLLKGVDQRGFRFFTNYASAKAADLAANPACALAFVWPTLARQVRVGGHAQRISPRSQASTSPLVPGEAASGRGLRARARSSPAARSSRTAWPSWRLASPAPTTSPCLRSGVATWSCPTASSSGRAGPTASTTVTATADRLRANRGWSSASHPDVEVPASPHLRRHRRPGRVPARRHGDLAEARLK